MTTQDILTFVHEQRAIRGVTKVLNGWSDTQILRAACHAISQNAFGWVVTNEKLSGFAFGIPREHEKVLDVTSLVCADKRSLAHLMLLFSQQYPGWRIRGQRKKKQCVVTYANTNRFVHLTQLNAKSYAQ